MPKLWGSWINGLYLGLGWFRLGQQITMSPKEKRQVVFRFLGSMVLDCGIFSH